jgi:hypothetical protein
MPFFKTTENIFKDKGEYFDPNWMDSDKLVLPPRTFWDYKRNMQIEDVDLWEVIVEAGYSIYAAWSPYAEFYMLIPTVFYDTEGVELYYGKGASNMIIKRTKELGIPISTNKIWVEPENMWLYE